MDAADPLGGPATYREVAVPETSSMSAQLALGEALRNTLGRGAYVVDRNGCLVDMDPPAEDLLGWTTEELRGRNIHESVHYLHPDGSAYPGHECPLLGVLESGIDFGETNDTFVTKDGGFLPVAYVSSPVIVDDEVVGAILAFWPR